MDQKNTIKGVILVALGASSFGMLASFVKLAYQSGYTTVEVTLSQVLLGLIGVFLINFFRKKNPTQAKASAKDRRNLILGGTTMGFTSVLYYLSVSYIDASIAVVLLMQSVWIGVVMESILTKKFPSIIKIVAVAMVLFGTLLATNVLQSQITLDIRGVVFGLLAALSFATTMLCSNIIATQLAAPQRSLFMLCGATIVVAIFTFVAQVGPNNFDFMRDFYSNFTNDMSSIRDFNWSIFYKWGIILALFGTILPPLFLTMGFPYTGVGLGSIISSLELPVSVSVAYFVLQEKVIALQWLGILLILTAILLMNSNLIFAKKDR